MVSAQGPVSRAEGRSHEERFCDEFSFCLMYAIHMFFQVWRLHFIFQDRVKDRHPKTLVSVTLMRVWATVLNLPLDRPPARKHSVKNT